MRIGDGVTEPVAIHMPHTQVPEELQKWKLRGVLIMEAVVQKDGSVGAVRTLRPQPVPLPSRPCVALFERNVASWRYKPATFQGRAVPAYLTVTVTHCPC